MESFDFVYTTDEVAKLFKCSPNAVRSMEDNGTLHRLPNVPGVKFSGLEVAQLLGKDYKTLKLETENNSLKKRVQELERRIATMMVIAQGGKVQ
jgi:DNA-binding transcriptional MerR regulator